MHFRQEAGLLKSSELCLVLKYFFSGSDKKFYSQMGDGCRIGKSCFRYNRNIISVQRKDSKILESTEGILLDTLELVVGDDQGGESAEVGEDEWRQH